MKRQWFRFPAGVEWSSQQVDVDLSMVGAVMIETADAYGFPAGSFMIKAHMGGAWVNFIADADTVTRFRKALDMVP